MADKRYSNRELDQYFKAADERADNFHGNLIGRMDVFEKDVRESLTRIELQTTKTNGRVNKLESWQSYVIGFCACLSLIVLPVVFMAVKKYIGL